MKRYVLLTLVLAIVAVGAYAQYNGKNSDRGNGSSFMDKMYFSGGGGFGTGTGPYGRYTYYSLLPTVGYRVTDDFLVGFNYSYSSYDYSDIGVTYSQSGYAPFLRYYFEQFFAQVEYASISSLNPNDNRIPRQFYDRLLIGGGFAQPVGKRGAVNVMGLYDVMYKTNGVFSSPWVFRVFFSF